MKPRTLLAAAMLAGLFAPATALSSPAAAEVKGEVLDVKDVQSYTYLLLKTREGETWAAVPTSAVKKGEQVKLDNPMVMHDFESKALKRKFDSIVFGSLAQPGAKVASASAGHTAPPPATTLVAKVDKATGPEAKTVAEVVATPSPLKDKTVAIRGRVVKYNPGIMGKNWIHLQDGSGSPASGTHDLVITTPDTTAVGEVVNARGTVRTNVDLGSGYTYAVLVEDARIQPSR